MLVIRLQRIGKKHQPSYRVVVAERRSKLGGPPVADLGAYDVFTKKLGVDKTSLEHWLKTGAQPSATVHNLFVKAGLVSGVKMPIKIRKPKTAEAPVIAAPQESKAEAAAENIPVAEAAEAAAEQAKQ